MSQIFAIAATAVAVMAAIFWIRSAIVSVPAPEGTSGVGALYGGYLIGQDRRGNRIDLLETYKRQSFWNTLAATTTAVSSLLYALSLAAPLALAISK